mmetsp:Transcript_15815/g.13829  ORF Transcript_15815/g.13829 Transcript_15815/m.13829 type:complete len:130 (+) Transcript_15815:198-587(+)
MLVYIISVRPYDSFLSTGLSMINDFLLVTMLIGCSKFLNPVMTPALSRILGNIFVGIVIGTIIVNWASIAVYGVGMVLKKKLKKRKITKLREKYNVAPCQTVQKMKNSNNQISIIEETSEEVKTHKGSL